MKKERTHNNPYKVPENYFESLQDNLTEQKKRTTESVIFKKWIWMPTLMILGVIVFYTVNSQFSKTDKIDPVIAFLLDEEISEEEIFDFMYGEELVKENTISVESIEEYLLEEDFDIDDILEIE